MVDIWLLICLKTCIIIFKAIEHKSNQADKMARHMRKPQIQHKLYSIERGGNNSLKEPTKENLEDTLLSGVY